MSRIFRCAFAALCLVATSRADLDLNSNGLGDVWEAKYRPSTLVQNEDSDRDGQTNKQEAEAGTDPFSGTDVFAVSEIRPQGANLVLKWPSQAGKRYQLQSTTTISVPNSWANLPGLYKGVAGELSATVAKPANSLTFFRVVVGDVDSDGDGLTDWEEIQAGSNPNGGNDLAAVTAALQAPSVVTLISGDAEATEPSSGPAADSGSFRVKRSGGIGRVLVKVQASGSASASDYATIPTTIAVPLAATEVSVPLTPVPDTIVESDELAVLTVQTDAAYTRGSAITAGVIIKDGILANGTGLLASFWKHPVVPPATTPALNTPYFTGPPNLTRVDATVNFDNAVAVWPGTPITNTAGTASDHFSSRWEGEILPEYSQTYTFFTNGNEMCRLWINGQLLPLITSGGVLLDNDWESPPVVATQGEASAIVTLEGGRRYPIVMEHFQNTGGHRATLSWQSASQTKQIIPQTRLFPNAPPRIYAPFDALGFIGGPTFNYQVKASAAPTTYAAVNLPPGLTINNSGLISGSPTTAGEWKVMLTATNNTGSGSAFLTITIVQTSNGITRHTWSMAPGTGITDIPVTTNPTTTTLLNSLAAPSDAAENYGTRIRGFLTAPETGEYRFYLRADEAAQFFLSDDDEVVNSWKRAELTAPVSSSDWSTAATSPLLHLEAGRRYYLEVLHKENTGTDHLAVGWLTPSEMAKATPVISTVPGHVLTRFEDVTMGAAPAFTPPAAPPNWTTETNTGNTNFNAASRFLQQATFGADTSDITALTGMDSYDEWIDDEFAKPVTKHLPYVQQYRNVTNPNNSTYPGTLTFSSWWKNSIQGDDQLRQRIAFALSEIMVISETGPLDERADTISDYYDLLLDHSFGNVRDLLQAVTLHPAMGRYLDMLGNDKPSLTAGRIPNENYAREILQLFSLGLYRLNPDGTPILNSKGELIPVYDQDSIIGYAHVFTGWSYNYTGAYRTSFPSTSNWIDPMREVPARHFSGRKRLLNNVVLPGIPVLNGSPLNPYADHSGAAISGNADFQASPALELNAVHDQLFNHPNIGPFLCSQLIQRLVTSTPTPGYVYRVVQKFNDNGSGVRGDMKAVIKAILLDYEARSLTAAAAPKFGKQREPLLRVTQLARAFRPANNFAGTYTQDGGLITVDTGAMNHRLGNGQKVLLGFSGANAQAQDGDYSLIAAPPATSFTVRTRDIFRGTWTQAISASLISITTPGDHGFATGDSAYLRFRTGIAGTSITSGVFTVTRTGNTTFTVTAPDAAAAARSGEIDVAYFRGGYSQAANGVLNVTCGTLPGLAVDSKLTMNFTSISNPAPPNGLYMVKAISDTEPRRLTIEQITDNTTTPPTTAIPATTVARSGTFNGAPHTPTLDRTGNAVSGYSDWNVGSTDTSLGQTPLNSPTVFNFFTPDYKFPGILANSNMVTPEFQISSDTNVIRQANFLFGGIYHSTSGLTSGYTNGFSSFVGGAHDIMMDFSPWMAPRTQGGTDYWTNTNNLRDLIRELAKILMPGQMSQAMEDQIYNYVSVNTGTGFITYPASPSDAQRRDRARAVIYFIAVSPEHAIQR